jgi:hypothetical protein
MASKELNKIVKQLVDDGFEIRRTSKGHLRVSWQGRPVTTFPGSASDFRSMKNCMADNKRFKRDNKLEDPE